MTPTESVSLDLDDCTYLGGSYYDLTVGHKGSISFQREMLVIRLMPPPPPRWTPALRQADSSIRPTYIPLPEILSISISGPGQVTTGGGVIGGGFGVAGALEGIAIAGIRCRLDQAERGLPVTANAAELAIEIRLVCR